MAPPSNSTNTRGSNASPDCRYTKAMKKRGLLMGLLSMVRKKQRVRCLSFPTRRRAEERLSCTSVEASSLVVYQPPSSSSSLPLFPSPFYSAGKKRGEGEVVASEVGNLDRVGGERGEIPFVIRRICILETKKILTHFLLLICFSVNRYWRKAVSSPHCEGRLRVVV